MSLKQKFIFLVSLPMLALFLLSSFEIWSNYKKLKETDEAIENTKLIQSASKLTHALQKERGKSALYLGKGISLDQLNEQRSQTIESFKNFESTFASFSYDGEVSNERKEVESKLNEARKLVDSNAPSSDVIKTYSQTILHLFNIEIHLSNISKAEGNEKKLMSTATLGLAKENAGKTRALVSNILATNSPLTNQQTLTLSSLRSGILENLESPTLIVSQNAQEKLKVFKDGTDWKKSIETVSFVLENAQQGNYGKNPKEFFDNISNTINEIGEIIFTEQNLTKEQIINYRGQISNYIMILSLSLFIVFTLISLFCFYFIRSITKPIQQIMDTLTTSTESITSTSNVVMENGLSLAQASEQQAAAVQETVSSLEEIGATVEKNSQSAKASFDLSEKSTQTATVGQEIIHKMNDAIGEISDSNEKINVRINLSHEELNEVVKIISDISQKTKVINDIVFQTKLLSFNASVEAARAGEAGKGFAVVAEEIGKLAIMSGTAAHEITEVLNSSLHRVNSSVENTKTQVAQIMDLSRSKVETGIATVHECSNIFNQIVDQIQQINHMINEISHASTEQNQGIHFISKAMSELDVVTNTSAQAASSASKTGTALNTKAQEILTTVDQLSVLINGKSAVHHGKAHM